MGMKASAREVYGKDGLSGKKVMVQGVGHVGEHLVSHLVKEGAVVFISDIHEDRTSAVANQYKVTSVKTDEVYDLDVDIYAPCALGATVNDDTIDKFKCH
jgi:leucine dehydrogenase